MSIGKIDPNQIRGVQLLIEELGSMKEVDQGVDIGLDQRGPDQDLDLTQGKIQVIEIGQGTVDQGLDLEQDQKAEQHPQIFNRGGPQETK